MDIRKINKILTQRVLLIHLGTQYFNRVNIICVCITIIDHFGGPDSISLPSPISTKTSQHRIF